MNISPKDLQAIMRDNPDIIVIGDDYPGRTGSTLAAIPPTATRPQNIPIVVPSEHDEQVYLFEWAAANQVAHPELAMLFAIPNGGLRHPAVAAMLRQEGVRAGVPDMALMVPRGRWHGLFLELKRCDHSNQTTEAQNEWITNLRHHGYSAVVCFGAEEAIQVLMGYLSIE